MTQHGSKLEVALDQLRREIEVVVREEQLRDQLTGLPNNLALSEKLKSAIEDQAKFWCALVEVDYFKRIYDKFTCAVADGLLQKIAKRLEGFEDYMPGTFPVRAHGDEFYLLGSYSGPDMDGVIESSLNRVREEISGISVPTKSGRMNCTVSIGWMTTSDAADDVLAEREVLRMTEAAVGAAKVRGRNRVVRYSREVEKSQRRSVRDDCPECKASFTVEIPFDSPHTGDLSCPNCGAKRPRPSIA